MDINSEAVSQQLRRQKNLATSPLKSPRFSGQPAQTIIHHHPPGPAYIMKLHAKEAHANQEAVSTPTYMSVRFCPQCHRFHEARELPPLRPYLDWMVEAGWLEAVLPMTATRLQVMFQWMFQVQQVLYRGTICRCGLVDRVYRDTPWIGRHRRNRFPVGADRAKTNIVIVKGPPQPDLTHYAQKS
jgi:hypothetical protein